MHEWRADVVVVGAGPAGLAAAVTAAESGAATLILDDGPRAGGRIWGHDAHPAAASWLMRAEAAGVRRLAATTVVSADPDRGLLIDSNERLERVLASNIVLACGAQERLLPFPGWTLPNVMGVGGLLSLAQQGLAVRGQRVVIAGSGPLLRAAAAELSARGARVLAVVEQAPRSRVFGFGMRALLTAGRRRETLRLLRASLGVLHVYDAWPVRATGTEKLSAVSVHHGGRESTLSCDILACAFGLVPRTRIAAQLGCRIDEECVAVDAHQQTSVPNVYCAGEATGIAGADAATAEGVVAGAAAAGSGATRLQLSKRDQGLRFARTLARAFSLRPELARLAAPDTIVCRCEDVPMAAIDGYQDGRTAKLQTRCGMGACQGRICGPALQFCRGLALGRPRPPLFPVPIEHLMRTERSPGTPSCSS